ncbi:MAG: xanthine dehydrogenase family protein molybdopterin-binding subunit [Rhodobacteraceae bacterium]|nr:xanthine dehydrogenase family protein molybdopterin-binding subunit [Paracoccaceae bacterium]
MNHFNPVSTTVDRRGFLGTAAGGLTLAVTLSPSGGMAARDGETVLNAYVQITDENEVFIVTPGCEIGQGVYTGLPKILCEELEADWDAVQVRLATADDAFINPAKKRQSTGNSDAVIAYTDLLLKTGAQAREMLIAAAAKQWKVDPSECRAENGVIMHDASNRSVTFGQVASAAAKLPIPAEPKLKSPDQYKLIGHDFTRKDTPAKCDGSADFGADIKLDGLVVATLTSSPVAGGQVKSYNEAAALSVPGVVKLVPVDNGSGTGGLAAVAQNFYQAKKALDAALIEWDSKGKDNWSTEDMRGAFAAAVNDPAKPFPPSKRGDVAQALASAAKTLDVTYEVPYVSHACMEPMSSTALITDDSCKIWSPTQQQGAAKELAATLTGLPLEKVTLQNTFSGGGFGRKWELDFTRQVVQIAMAMKGTPVRMYWSREEDIQHDYFRPAVTLRMRGGLDAGGSVVAMHATAVGQSLLKYQGRPLPIADPTVAGGTVNLTYGIPNTLIEHVDQEQNVPIGFWRSVSASSGGFFAESAIDELAVLAGKDPLEFRRELLAGKERELAALNFAAEKAGWGKTLPAGHGMGLAFTPGFGSIIVQIAEVSVKDGTLKVERLVCTGDCGRLIEPRNVEAQLQGGTVFGLSAALFENITVENGAVAQSNFYDYQVARMAHVPDLEVHIIPSDAKPGGVGESAVPGVAPAIANAIYAATGQRLRRLPLSAAGLTVA